MAPVFEGEAIDAPVSIQIRALPRRHRQARPACSKSHAEKPRSRAPGQRRHIKDSSEKAVPEGRQQLRFCN